MTLKDRVLLASLWLLAASCFCWGTELEYEVKAEYLERFTRFIDWPADSFAANHGGRFRLCVIGKNPFGSYLQEMTREVKFKGKPAEIKLIQDPRRTADCDLLFIANSEEARLKEVLQITKDKPILTISDTPGFAEVGVAINFYNQDAKIRFEINNEAIKRNRLHVSSRLLDLARQVKETSK